jgi:imidazolonepropionase-like amidohydrolase
MSAAILLTRVQVFDGERLLPGRHDVLVEDGVIRALAAVEQIAAEAERLEGGLVTPGLVDAHVHLTFSTPEEVVRGGVTAVLDLGAPPRDAFAPHPPLKVRAAGPLLTAPGGYPTRSWGAGGYGLELPDASSARRAVASLADAGAAIVKVALADEEQRLDPETLRAITEEAHDRGLRAVAHALSAETVRRALDAGIDALAHTPVERLPDDLVDALAARDVAVISTIRAFGSGEAARANLVALAGAGCRLLYGTDLGNGGIAPGADPAELVILARALGSADAALRAATSAAAEFAGFRTGRVAEGRPADLVVVDSYQFASFRRPRLVLVDGVPVK